MEKPISGKEDIFQFDFCQPMIIPKQSEKHRTKMFDDLLSDGYVGLCVEKNVPQHILTSLKSSGVDFKCIIHLVQYNRVNYEC